MNTIIIYGPGCAKCTELLENTKKITAEMEGEFSIKKITDPMQFAVAGVFMTPGLSLNGKLLFSGRNPSIAELKTLLNEALGTTETPDAAPTPTAGTNCNCKCNSGCSEGKESAKPCACKKVILWIIVIILALAAIKTLNRSNKEDAPRQHKCSALTLHKGQL